MPVNVSQQTVVFFACILAGILSGIEGDFLNITAQKLRFNKSAVFIKDITFWLIILAFFFTVIYRINGAVLRWYVFLGGFFGALFYLLLIRCRTVKIISAVMDFLFKTAEKLLGVLLFPFKKICKLFAPVVGYVQIVRKKKDIFVKKNIEKLRRINILLKKV